MTFQAPSLSVPVEPLPTAEIPRIPTSLNLARDASPHAEPWQLAGASTSHSAEEVAGPRKPLTCAPRWIRNWPAETQETSRVTLQPRVRFAICSSIHAGLWE